MLKIKDIIVRFIVRLLLFSLLLIVCAVLYFHNDIISYVMGEEEPIQHELRDYEFVERTFDFEIDGFCYRQLNSYEQKFYPYVYNCIITRDEPLVIPITTYSYIDHIVEAILNDHPEIFYIDGYSLSTVSYRDGRELLLFAPKYIYTEEEQLQREGQIEAYTLPIIEEVAAIDDRFEKVKYLFDTIISISDYDVNAVDNQNICSVFIGHTSSCQGYSKALQYLLQKVGIESSLVTGNVASGENHVWNIVKLEDSYYHLDVTWGDVYFEDEERQKNPLINYDYLCSTTKDITKTHQIISNFTIPNCTDIKYNYYTQEGLLLEQADLNRVRDILCDAAAVMADTITIKCVSSEVYAELVDELITQRKIFGLLPFDKPQVTYMSREDQLSICFWLTDY